MGSLTHGKLAGRGGISEISPVGESNTPFSSCACHAHLEGRGGGPGSIVGALGSARASGWMRDWMQPASGPGIQGRRNVGSFPELKKKPKSWGIPAGFQVA